MRSSKSSEPKPVSPDGSWQHVRVYERIREALYSMSLHFRSETTIEGVLVTDIFTLGSALGATIENQVVSTLNQMRSFWDPGGDYRLYSFMRQPQTFPDVLLRKRSGVQVGEVNHIVLGIELKGWYLLAKEGEPSFRFQVTPGACAAQDLIVVVPWALSNVISGTPMLFTPFVESARYAAEYRNYHWRYLRESRLDKTIDSPEGVSPYPRKADQIGDRPRSDAGNNFGRFARTGLMDQYMQELKSEMLCGIKAEYWLSFFKIFQENAESDKIRGEIARLRTRAAESQTPTDARGEVVRSILSQVEHLLDS